MCDLLPFADALEKVSEDTQTCVLLGNGFSCALLPKVFSYKSLFQKADFSGLTTVKKVFDGFDTYDFERVMRALQDAAKVVASYQPDLVDKITADASKLRDVLANVIADRHPSRPDEIEDDKYRACRGFLHHFHKVFTVNYDLLLYWVVNREGFGCNGEIPRTDGFTRADGGELEWKDMDTAEVIHLHGALHLFDTGESLVKLEYELGTPLIKQVKRRLEEDRFPHIVAEGTHRQKHERIRRSPYLRAALASLARVDGDLFVHGVSMGDEDKHVLDAVRDSGVNRLFVGIHGDPGSERNRTLIEKARLIRSKTEFYDATSARVWGGEDALGGHPPSPA